MEVNYKMISILEIVFAADGGIPIQDAMEIAGITRRALLYNIEKINSFLEELGCSPIDVCRGQLSWDIAQEQAVKQALGRQHSSQYVLSKRERKAVAVIYAAVSCEAVTLELLCRLFDVSRNTVLSEIGELKNELGDIGILLNSLGRGGYRLEGEETTIRYYVMECYYSLQSEVAARQGQEIICTAAAQRCGSSITDSLYQQLCGIVEDSERYTSLRFNNNSIHEAVLYLLLVFVRAGCGYSTQLEDDLRERSEYQAAGRILQQLQTLGIVIPVQEQGYITTVLLASKVFDIDRHPGSGSINLEAFAGDLVDTFSAKACVRFDNRDELVERLLLHVRPMYYRLKYRIKVRNVLTEEIRSRYRELFNLTDLALKTIEQRYGLSVPDDEIAYLCVYIGGWMKRYLPAEQSGVPRLLIVCGAGIGTSLLLRDQISSLLGPGYLYVTKDERETDCSDCLTYRLIVTTVELGYTGGNIIRVSPILTQSQQNKLLAWSVEDSGSGELGSVADLLKIVRQHAVISDEGGLVNSLLSYFTHGKMVQHSAPRSILEVLPPSHLELLDACMDAKEAIQCCCRVLIQEGIVGQAYPVSILEIIDMLGLYAEIADGILLAHGRPDENVSGVGLTLTLLRQPVFFPKWDKEIRAIFTLASPNNEEHLFILRDIMTLLRQREVCQRLTACDFTNAAQAYDYLVQALNQCN